MAKYWYYQSGCDGEPKYPCWSGPAKRPSKPLVERHEFGLNGKTPAQVLAEVEKFKKDHELKKEPKFVKTWSSNYLYADYEESQESLEKRQAQWDTERAAYKSAMEKYKPLKKKWDAKQAARYAQQQNTEDNFVVVKLTPAQYKKLMNST
jgi:hypothetical protein